MKIVLDTSILIDNLRGGKLWNKLLDRTEEQDAKLYIPTIVIYELYAGKSTRNTKIRNLITSLIKNFRRIELTEEIAKRSGEMHRDLGMRFGPQDYIIASSAIELNATLVTLNKKHFKQIPNLTLYPL